MSKVKVFYAMNFEFKNVSFLMKLSLYNTGNFWNNQSIMILKIYDKTGLRFFYHSFLITNYNIHLSLSNTEIIYIILLTMIKKWIIINWSSFSMMNSLLYIFRRCKDNIKSSFWSNAQKIWVECSIWPIKLQGLCKKFIFWFF